MSSRSIPMRPLIERLKRGDLPVSEPGLPELIDRYNAALSFSADDAALGECDLIYVAVDVPTDDRGQSDLGAGQGHGRARSSQPVR